MCGCEVRRMRVRMFNESAVPAKFHGARLRDDQRDDDNFDAFNSFTLLAKNYSRNDRGIILMGAPGTGKTHLVVGFLIKMQNVVLLPHLGSATLETRVAMGLRAIENVKAFFDGEEPGDRVA